MVPQRPEPTVTGPEVSSVSGRQNSLKSSHPIVDIQNAFVYVDGANCLPKITHCVSTGPRKRSSNKR